MKSSLRLFAFTLFLLQLWLAKNACANPFIYEWHELAPGVWAAIRADPFELPQEGNAVFVVTDGGVVLFDAGGSPSMGDSIVAKVRSVTPQPITHVVLSHWHGDHMRGLQAIQAAFPEAQIFAHPHSRDMIADSQEKWLKRRVSMVPNIRKNFGNLISTNKDMSGRPLIEEEKAWIENGLAIVDELDKENNRTVFVLPTATIDREMTLRIGEREMQFIDLGKAHTAGDLVMWLPKEKIIATGDIVTAPVPLMPSAYTSDYVGVLDKIEALEFKMLVPGHGPVQFDAQYVDLLIETIQTSESQMKAFFAQAVSKEDAIAKIDYASVEKRYTRGDAFLTNRFQDYVRTALAQAAYEAALGNPPTEVF